MASAPVRPELGPTLLGLVRGPWGRLGRRGRRWLVGVVVALAVVAFVALGVLRSSRSLEELVSADTRPQFTLAYPDDRLGPTEPGRGQLLRLRTLPGIAGPETFTLRDGGPTPPRALGDPVSQLALRFAPIERRLDDLEGFQLRGEGRTRINEASGWAVRFQYLEDGRTYYGVRLLLTPDEPVPGQRMLDVDIRAARSPVTPNAALAGANGPMKTALQSVRFGTERP